MNHFAVTIVVGLLSLITGIVITSKIDSIQINRLKSLVEHRKTGTVNPDFWVERREIDGKVTFRLCWGYQKYKAEAGYVESSPETFANLVETIENLSAMGKETNASL